ncbi:hypothetical protein [Stutzerimonas xanthomarina]|uniref:HNH endonuclease n=2 Tax=Stutzerimonas xanthomarina TaxID=271420 RepID=A0A1M5RPV6_9GAMM|nr:hypothetical protein [Stutzerimonas xanthomarina]MCP9339226.1 hypothetical protein [Stutzerimonas xanthomarina]SEH95260.1 hypothetical protein SAMN05216535_2926 [Stutzerimonas xanthomarina]SHH27863.1 hypothetical protein SAMN02744645_3155 [Stutzerimonas xanthomarina DSM 18231]
MASILRLPDQPEACELCLRQAPLTRHHLIPKALHGKTGIRKRFPREECITATLWVCRPCHNQIHRLFSEKKLALSFHSRDALLADPRLRTFVDWLSTKPAGFVPRH